MTDLIELCKKLNQFLEFELKIKIKESEIKQKIQKLVRNFEGQTRRFSFYYEMNVENILVKADQVESLAFTFFSEQNLKSFKVDIVESKILGTYANFVFAIELSFEEKPTVVIKKFRFIGRN